MSHSYLPQIDQIQLFGLLYLQHKTVCISEVSVVLLNVIVCFLKELFILYTIKVFYIVFPQMLNLMS